MTQWEYYYIVAYKNDVYEINEQKFLMGKGKNSLPPYLNKLGSEGWELVGISHSTNEYWRLIFKRPSQHHS